MLLTLLRLQCKEDPARFRKIICLCKADLENVQAGNSGLCGGSVPISDEIILLTSQLDKVISFDDVRIPHLQVGFGLTNP